MHFYFDPDCGFCQASARVLQRWCRPELQVTGGTPSDPAAVTAEIRRHAVYSNGGHYFFGHAAIAHCLQDAGASWMARALGRLAGLPVIPRLLYWAVARNRARLSRLLGTHTCRLS
ncbi:hypothetical protein CPHO_03005 [Corynebacterium phocae]|uniref:Thiol-disulfide oxidoreductase n=1 Tax=Corynebacterium phocae TaxID=161895 RepID=A0A1L7D1Q4_9CORY|nr:DCC1-like thiol-disulfide oxidoreductase family protein [Corynebacterium phocae]APT92034.1 hypothetical protein CPHO_03005 [Corynebacterium phocae]